MLSRINWELLTLCLLISSIIILALNVLYIIVLGPKKTKEEEEWIKQQYILYDTINKKYTIYMVSMMKIMQAFLGILTMLVVWGLYISAAYDRYNINDIINNEENLMWIKEAENSLSNSNKQHEEKIIIKNLFKIAKVCMFLLIIQKKIKNFFDNRTYTQNDFYYPEEGQPEYIYRDYNKNLYNMIVEEVIIREVTEDI